MSDRTAASESRVPEPGVLDALVTEARRRWGLDLAAGLQIVAAETLAATPIEASRPALVVPLARLGAVPPAGAVLPLPGRHGPSGRDALAILRRLYPAGHPVGRLDRADGTTVDLLTSVDLGEPLYLAPVPPEESFAGPWSMPWISNRLRAPDGCPWDREQTHQTLRKHLLEEAYEVYDALEAGATPELAEELGDLLLQVVLHAQLAAEEGVFDLADVQAAIASKIVRRHPHVFGEAEARTAADVNRQWERIKAAEREAAARGGAPGEGAARLVEPAIDREVDVEAAETGQVVLPGSALDGISASMPALAASQEMQERAANLGYDWPDVEGVVEKVAEEVDELLAAETPDEWREEFGDLLTVLVNLARRHGVEAEASLRQANDKFRRRFGIVERLAAARGVALRDLDFEALDELWEAAKAEEVRR